MNASGPLMDRSTWDSAAKCTIDIEPVFAQQLLDQRRVADIAVDEMEILLGLNRVEIGEIPGISQGIEHHDEIARVLASQWWTKFVPMNPAPPVTNSRDMNTPDGSQ